MDQDDIFEAVSVGRSKIWDLNARQRIVLLQIGVAISVQKCKYDISMTYLLICIFLLPVFSFFFHIFQLCVGFGVALESTYRHLYIETLESSRGKAGV